MDQLEYRFCPRCGGGLESRVLKEGEPERLVCSGCGFVFYLGPKLVAGAIFEVDGGILLIKRGIEPGYGRWTFPGGYVERGEVAEEAARREVAEETGIEVEVGPILGLYSYEGQLPAIAVFEGRATGGRAHPGDEVLSVESFAPAEIPWEELAFPSTKEALRDYLGE